MDTSSPELIYYKIHYISSNKCSLVYIVSLRQDGEVMVLVDQLVLLFGDS